MQPATRHDIFSTVSKNDYIGVVNPKHTVEFLDFHKSDVSQATDLPKNSIRYDKRISSELKTRILEIGNIINIVADHFDGDLEKTRLWFYAENLLLGDISPRDMIRYGRYLKLRKFILNALSDRNP